MGGEFVTYKFVTYKFVTYKYVTYKFVTKELLMFDIQIVYMYFMQNTQIFYFKILNYSSTTAASSVESFFVYHARRR